MMRYARAAGFGVVCAFVALAASFALIDLGLTLWVLFVDLVMFRAPLVTALALAWNWAAKVWGAYAVDFATVGFFFGWVKSLRHVHK